MTHAYRPLAWTCLHCRAFAAEPHDDMHLIFRTVQTILGARRRSRLQPFAVSVRRFRVLPNDLDLNGHMNNGRYLSVMDLGRVELMIRFGVFREAVRRRWVPVIGSASIRYRRSLDPLRSYALETQLLCWDEKWFYLRQRFMRGDDMVAVAHVKGAVTSPEGLVAPSKLVELAGFAISSPPMPDGVRAWTDAEDAMVRAAAEAPRPEEAR